VWVFWVGFFSWVYPKAHREVELQLYCLELRGCVGLPERGNKPMLIGIIVQRLPSSAVARQPPALVHEPNRRPVPDILQVCEWHYTVSQKKTTSPFLCATAVQAGTAESAY